MKRHIKYSLVLRLMLVTILTGLFGFSDALAQMLPNFSQYQQSMYYFNPSTAGFENMSVLTSFRKEWSGFDNAPQTLFVGFNLNLNGLEADDIVPSWGHLPDKGTKKSETYKNGLSAFYIKDTYGFVKQDNFMINYSRHYRITTNYYVSLGIGAGLFHLGFNNNVSVHDVTDPFYNQFVGNVPTLTTFDANAGLSLYSEKFYFTYFASHIVGSKIKFKNDSPFDEYLDLSHQISAALKLSLTPDILLIPNISFKAINPYSNYFELGIRAKYKKNIYTGIAYRNNKALILSLGYKYNRFVVGYSYDYNTARTSRVNNLSHEFVLGYQIRDKATMPKRFDW